MLEPQCRQALKGLCHEIADKKSNSLLGSLARAALQSPPSWSGTPAPAVQYSIKINCGAFSSTAKLILNNTVPEFVKYIFENN